MYSMRRMTPTAVGIALLAVACGRTDGDLSRADSERIRSEVESALHEAYDLSKPDPVNRMLSLYPASGRVISANTGRATTSRDTVAADIRAFWNNVGVNMRDPKWEWTNIYVDVLSASAAVVTATYRIPHRNPNNLPHVLSGAMTVVLKRQGGRWMVIQEHLSDGPQSGDSTTNMATHENH